jgi:hypothetical protein
LVQKHTAAAGDPKHWKVISLLAGGGVAATEVIIEKA